MNIKKLLTETKKIVAETGLYTEREFLRFKRSRIECKSNFNDLVSYVDKETERRLISKLMKLTPDASFIGEENTRPPEKSELTWIIDPIDGTTNFVHGIPLFAISVGLLYRNNLAVGIVYNPVAKEMFYASSETPAMMNRQPIRVSPTTKIKEGIISVGISPTSLIGIEEKDKNSREWFFKTLPALMGKVRGVRALGSAAISLAWVAAGRIDAYYEKGLNSWDIAGGSLIIRQAGGRVTDFSKNKDFLFKKELIATGKVYPQFHQLLKDHRLL